MQKSIKIGKSLISSASQESEWSSKSLVKRLLPPNFRVNISKYFLRCKPKVASATIFNWFLSILQLNWKKISIEISFNIRLFLRYSAQFSYTSRRSSANPHLQLIYVFRVL